MQILQRSLAGIALLFAASPAWSQARPAAPAPAAPAPPAAAAPAPPAAAPAPAPPAPVLAPTGPAVVPTPATTPPGGGAPIVLAPQGQPLPPPGPEGPPAPAPAAAAAEAAPVAATPAPAPVAPAPVDRLAVGKNEGFFQPGALLQFWGFMLDNGTTHTTTFRLRRAELRVKGEIVPKLVGYNVMIDPAKLAVFNTAQVPVAGLPPTDPPTVPAPSVAVPQPGPDRSILQDFFITFMSEYADVSVGQFKNQVSWEGFNGSSKLILPERSQSSRYFGDRRDIGLKIEKKIGDYFFYSAGIFNGSGQNSLDGDNEKDLALRLEVYPVKGLTVGVLGYATTLGPRDGTVRDRIEGDVRYEGHDFLVQAEYIRGRDGAEAARTDGHGGYAALGYTFIERIQPVVRVGLLDQNLDVTNNTMANYEFGLNYYLRQHEAKLGLAVAAFDPQAEGADTRWEGTLLAQVSF